MYKTGLTITYKLIMSDSIFSTYIEMTEFLLGCWDRSTGQSVGRNSNLKPHHTDMWRCQGRQQLQTEAHMKQNN